MFDWMVVVIHLFIDFYCLSKWCQSSHWFPPSGVYFLPSSHYHSSQLTAILLSRKKDKSYPPTFYPPIFYPLSPQPYPHLYPTLNFLCLTLQVDSSSYTSCQPSQNPTVDLPIRFISSSPRKGRLLFVFPFFPRFLTDCLIPTKYHQPFPLTCRLTFPQCLLCLLCFPPPPLLSHQPFIFSSPTPLPLRHSDISWLYNFNLPSFPLTCRRRYIPNSRNLRSNGMTYNLLFGCGK